MPIKEEDIPEILDTIRFSLKFRIFDNAILLCNELISQFINPEVLTLFAKAFLESGSPKQATALIRQHIRIAMESVECRLIYAKSLLESGDYFGAEAELNKFLDSSITERDNEYLVAAQYYIGIARNRTHRFSSSKQNFESVLVSKPLLLTAIQNQYKDVFPPGAGSSEIKDGEIPLLCTQTLIEHPMIDPEEIKYFPDEFRNSIPYLNARASYFFHKSDFEMAAKVFQKMLHDFPFSTIGMDLYSTTLWQIKEKNKLIALSSAMLELAPGSPEPWVVEGNSQSLQQNNSKAIVMFNRASSVDRSYSYGLTLAGHEALSQQFVEQAQNCFREATMRNPLDYSAWYGLGTILYNENKFQPARYYMRRAQQINKSSSVLKFILGQTEYRCGNTDECLRLFDEAIEMDPNNLAVKYQKGCVLSELGEFEEAMKCFHDVSGPVPDEPSAKFMEGKCAIEEGKIDEGLKYMVKALTLGYPNKSEIYGEIGCVVDDMIKNILK